MGERFEYGLYLLHERNNILAFIESGHNDTQPDRITLVFFTIQHRTARSRRSQPYTLLPKHFLPKYTTVAREG